ncbi:MAG: gas vesicle protein K [Acidobacteriota bacterium]
MTEDDVASVVGIGPDAAPTGARRVEINADDAARGLTQLVLTLVRLLHELLERQAIHRLEAGTLDDDEIERVGAALQAQAREIERLCEILDLDIDDLNLDLGPLGQLL